MDEEVTAFLQKVVPGEKSSRWYQQSVKRTLDNWEENRPDDFEVIVDSNLFSVAVGYYTYPSEVGQYGYDTGLHFRPDFEEHILDDAEGGHLVDPFFEDWMKYLQEVIREDQEKTSLSPKEYATFYAHRNPSWHEAKSADALDISVGTYRGKVGRVKSKLEEARHTLQIDEDLPDSKSEDAWSGGSYSAPFSVLHRVNESNLPINAVWHMEGEGTSIDDVPLEELLR